MVTVHYTGWTTDGKMFDSSYARGVPSTFRRGALIKGWGEGVQLMVVGEKRRLWIPEELAYKGQPKRPQGMLVFDIELLEISASPSIAPPDVAAPPADAKKTPSGLAYKVLRAGKGTAHPERRSRVTVHYTGWTTDGKMFDSSVERGSPATFGLDEVIEGWTEGVQLMVEGERTRFWIPERLAYKGQSGAPRGHARVRHRADLAPRTLSVAIMTFPPVIAGWPSFAAGVLIVGLDGRISGVSTAQTAIRLDGYAEWRKAGVLVVDGQRVRADERTKWKGTFTAIPAVPLGHEVRVQGVRQPDGRHRPAP